MGVAVREGVALMAVFDRCGGQGREGGCAGVWCTAIDERFSQCPCPY